MSKIASVMKARRARARLRARTRRQGCTTRSGSRRPRDRAVRGPRVDASSAPHPVKRRHETQRIVGANHAAAAREHGRLEDHRERRRVTARSRDRSPAGTAKNSGTGRPAALSRSRDSRLSRAIDRRVGRVTGQSQQPREVRRHHGRAIADGQHAGDRPRLERLQDGIDRSPFFVKTDGNGAVAPRVVEVIAAVGGVDDLDAERSPPPRRTCASGNRWWSPAAGRAAAPGPAVTRASASMSSSFSTAFIAEQPALRWAPLNSTRARPGTGSTVRGCGGAEVLRCVVPRCPGARESSEHLGPRSVDACAGNLHDLHLQLVDARIRVSPRERQRRPIERPNERAECPAARAGAIAR